MLHRRSARADIDRVRWITCTDPRFDTSEFGVSYQQWWSCLVLAQFLAARRRKAQYGYSARLLQEIQITDRQMRHTIEMPTIALLMMPWDQHQLLQMAEAKVFWLFIIWSPDFLLDMIDWIAFCMISFAAHSRSKALIDGASAFADTLSHLVQPESTTQWKRLRQGVTGNKDPQIITIMGGYDGLRVEEMLASLRIPPVAGMASFERHGCK